jgi:hypothetical protein
MNNGYTKPVLLLAMVLGTAAATAVSSTSFQRTEAVSNPGQDTVSRAPIATSGDNVYVVWWTNKSGDWEVMFKASSDNGKTFGPKINLSNSKGVVSDNAEIAAAGNNVYVSWWERANQTSNEPVLRISADNGKTFGPIIKLAANSTISVER